MHLTNALTNIQVCILLVSHKVSLCVRSKCWIEQLILSDPKPMLVFAFLHLFSTHSSFTPYATPLPYQILHPPLAPLPCRHQYCFAITESGGRFLSLILYTFICWVFRWATMSLSVDFQKIFSDRVAWSMRRMTLPMMTCKQRRSWTKQRFEEPKKHFPKQ